MTINMVTKAKCKKCKCIFIWPLDDVPFVDTEAIGTCDRCINNENHKCVNEAETVV